jgi:hypothetical protein
MISQELFPMRAAIPRSLDDVLQRMVQLQYTSRLTLDKKFFDKIDRLVDLMARIDEGLPQSSDVRTDPTYREMRAYRKIDHFNVVTSRLRPLCPTPRTSPGRRSRRAFRPGTTTPSRRGSAASTGPGCGSG